MGAGICIGVQVVYKNMQSDWSLIGSLNYYTTCKFNIYHIWLLSASKNVFLSWEKNRLNFFCLPMKVSSTKIWPEPVQINFQHQHPKFQSCCMYFLSSCICVSSQFSGCFSKNLHMLFHRCGLLIKNWNFPSETVIANFDGIVVNYCRIALPNKRPTWHIIHVKTVNSLFLQKNILQRQEVTQ